MALSFERVDEILQRDHIKIKAIEHSICFVVWLLLKSEQRESFKWDILIIFLSDHTRLANLDF